MKKIKINKLNLKKTIIAATLLLTTQTVFAKEVVNVYSLRQPELIKLLFTEFTKQTGIEVNVVFAKDGLLERIEQEGRNSPADVLLTVDISNLDAAVNAGVTQTIESDIVTKNIPAQFRDMNNQWVGLTQRTRIIVASKDRVKPGELLRYEDLSDPKWKGRICTRSGKANYNLALIGSMILADGKEDTQKWLSGLKSNLAKKPQGGDRDQIKSLAAGECDLAISNSYYLARLLDDSDQVGLDKKVFVIFPNQADRGAHANVSGAILAKNSPNKANAVKLIEYLTDDYAQAFYAEANREYPLKSGIKWNAHLTNWGEYKIDKVPLTDIAKTRSEAMKLVDIVKFDE